MESCKSYLFLTNRLQWRSGALENYEANHSQLFQFLWKTTMEDLIIRFRAYSYSKVGILCCVCSLEPTTSGSPSSYKNIPIITEKKKKKCLFTNKTCQKARKMKNNTRCKEIESTKKHVQIWHTFLYSIRITHPLPIPTHHSKGDSDLLRQCP